jgi:hypothetical protein
MMSTRELRFTRHPPPQLWLRPEPPADAQGALIGWVQDVAAIDEGVPDDVMRIITRALTQNYRLTFIDPDVEKSSQWRSLERHSTRFLKASRLAPWRGYGLTSTCDADIAVRLFATEGWLWHLQSQVVLLTSRDELAPEISFGTLHRLMQSRRLDIRPLRAELACIGVMTPGPDGDFAQLIFWQPASMSVFKEHLRAQAEQAQIGFVEVSKAEFQETKWLL